MPRRTITIDGGGSAAVRSVVANGTTLTTISPRQSISLWDWLREHAAEVLARLEESGAVLLRGFEAEPAGFAGVYDSLGCFPLAYRDGHTPRSVVNGNIYTSTEYPAAETIELHSEMSYALNWPDLVMFFCQRPAVDGGETPIADNAMILRTLDPGLAKAFREKGVLYRRTFTPGVGLGWQQAFGVSDRSELERLLPELGLIGAWQQATLVVEARRPATLIDPRRKCEVWFNQAQSFHLSTLSPSLRRAIADLGEEAYPNHAYFGDGSAIPDAAMGAVRAASTGAELLVRWKQADLLILDNLRVSHGRRPYRGERRLLAALASTQAGEARS
jgi:alpha-ketoglutarate-dependent taurine dioxygenase